MTPIRLALHRTFKQAKPQEDDESYFETNWLEYAGIKKSDLEWSDLLAKRVVVVLGEAGMGKTWEFEDEVKHLEAKGEPAFFIALNRVTSSEHFHLALDARQTAFDAWVESEQFGYFFLDAVDESRLNGIAALQQSLALIGNALKLHLPRVSFVISSRISDWHIPAVRDVIEKQLLAPIISAAKGRRYVAKGDTEVVEENSSPSDISIDVFRLAPLSKSEAKRLAEAHGAIPVDAFWQAVVDGDYEYLATRPRDVEWMAKRWSELKMLGNYSELLNAAVKHRLSERNQCYLDAGAVLSAQELRNGSECVAAASVLCKRPFIALPSEAGNEAEVLPSNVLPEWDAHMQGRLLGTALFDEATFGRVQFHHRSSREFLAAHWIAGRLHDGLPIADAIKLFVRMPYGVPVLVGSRRATLCWLATIDTQIREYVIANFPEMLMFEGDPESWSQDDVVDAFRGYVERLDAGFRPNWWNDLSELRRVARRLPSVVLNEYLNKFPSSRRITERLLSLIFHGRVFDCADAVFHLYQSKLTQPRFRYAALEVLATIGTDEHRQAIRDDLLKGQMNSNELLAVALTVVSLEAISTEELTNVLRMVQAESEYGGPIARAITEDLLPQADFTNALKLLEAIYNNLPEKKAGHAHIYESEVGSELHWKLHVLPDCLRRVVSQLDGNGEAAPKVLLDASLWMEQLRHTTYANEEDFRLLREEIERKPIFRKNLVIAIALSEGFPADYARLLWGVGQVEIRESELDWLVEQAHRRDLDPVERDLWFRLSVDIASKESEERRRVVFQMLTDGDDNEMQSRRAYIVVAEQRYAEVLRHRQEWKEEEVARKKEKESELAKNKVLLLKDLDAIRDGTQFNAIKWLVVQAANSNSRNRYTKVDLDQIAEDFGAEISSAFDQGLAELWRKHNAPSVVDYPDGTVPWVGLIGLASLNHAFTKGLLVKHLSDLEIAKAVQLCVWELDEPAAWFREIAKSRTAEALAALRSWFEHELNIASPEAHWTRTVDLVLRSPDEMRQSFLQIAMTMLTAEKITSAVMQKRIVRDALGIGLLDKASIGNLVRKMLEKDHAVVPIGLKQEWLGAWLANDLHGAWAWIQAQEQAIRTDTAAVAVCITRALEGSEWTEKLSGAPQEIEVLLALYDLLTPYIAVQLSSRDGDQSFHPVLQLRDAIPQVIAKLPGVSAYRGLVELKRRAKDDPNKLAWFHSLLVDHSVEEAERESALQPRDVMHIGDVYCRDPQTEQELFQQVMARLQEIKKSVEDGPFSDRLLFAPGMNEKLLQLWLAARLNDTPRRKFSTRFVVHREPQVDADKRTDIEISARGFKVCIEIKPVDSKRYTAVSLTDTLKTQLVGQYLKGGGNSRHGILVLFRLDEKKWSISGVSARAEFPALIDCLKQQATEILTNTPEINALDVVGIDCVQS